LKNWILSSGHDLRKTNSWVSLFAHDEKWQELISVIWVGFSRLLTMEIGEENG
jgi:hypothetical protein